ncbi:hypothetical protein KGY77_10075 [Candidatus Bipolaricaulota bacterium]|nr:hypothetical protein [Candidatus Bipolaricaulota bacterium]
MSSDIFDEGEFEDIESFEELQEAVQERVDEYNRTPKDELGGLTPEQAYLLLNRDWPGPDSPVTVRDNFSDSEANDVRFVNNARILLQTAREEEGLPATNAGNFKRVVVSDFLERMEFDPDRVEDIYEMNKVINEQDVPPLHILRVVLEVGDFLDLSGGSFQPTSKAISMLRPGRAGDFLKELFLTYFKEFNIAYFSRGKEWTEMQDTITYTFYQLSKYDENWHPKDEFIEPLIIHTIKKLADEDDWPSLDHYYSARVLKPLEKFELVESRLVGEGEFYEKDEQYRKTSLYDRFIEFKF